MQSLDNNPDLHSPREMRMTAEKWLVLAALTLGAVQPAPGDPFPPDNAKWLETMSQAAHRTDYTGTFVYQYGDHVEVSRITHVVDANGEHGRLESMDGTRREIIRNNNDVWCVIGERKYRMVHHGGGQQFPALLQDPRQLAEINKFYVVRNDGEGRVADFHAHAILFMPRDQMRYGYRMWADSSTGLLLKAEVLDRRGKVVEQYAFTQLTVGGNIDRSWIAGNKPPVMPAAARQQAQAAPAPGAEQQVVSGWLVDDLPPGFHKIAELRRPIHDQKGMAIQMVYTDGLAGISVFIEDVDNDQDDAPGLTSQGAIQVYSKLEDDHLVTVVGEVPPQTVMRIADSVHFAGK